MSRNIRLHICKPFVLWWNYIKGSIKYMEYGDMALIKWFSCIIKFGKPQWIPQILLFYYACKFCFLYSNLQNKPTFLYSFHKWQNAEQCWNCLSGIHYFTGVQLPEIVIYVPCMYVNIFFTPFPFFIFIAGENGNSLKNNLHP